jgi:hypothetical protein
MEYQSAEALVVNIDSFAVTRHVYQVGQLLHQNLTSSV